MSLRPTVTLHDGQPASTEGSDDWTLDASQLPAHIGRFAIVGVLGTGGMGTVFEAYDPTLGRRVAIKVLHTEVSGGHDRRQSLRREARALARLSHPNVVQVFEAGEHEGRIYVVMERVVGPNLSGWLAERARSFEDIRDMLCAAGRGLVAAHARRLLHRDFKPENVLVGEDGRPRVVDFGLVRRLPRNTSGTLTFASLGPPSVGRRTAGTVPFMAPEQLMGQSLDARVDQFAFCVTLYELLYGQHPFQAPGMLEVGLRIIAGEIDEPPPRKDVPGWLPAVLAQGMSVRPDDRFEDMEALLAALQPSRRRYRSPSRLLVGAAVALMATGGVASMQRSEPCAEATTLLTGTWDSRRQVELQQAFKDSGVDHARETWMRVRDRFDVQAARWRQGDRAVCEAEVSGTWDEPEVEARRRCLDERLVELRQLVDELSSPDATTLDRAVVAAAELGRVDECVDPRVAPSMLDSPLTALQEAAADEIRSMLADAELEEELGRPIRAVERLGGVVERADAVGVPALKVRARLVLGKVQLSAGRLPEAERTLADAFWLAQGMERSRAAVDAGILLVYIVGDAQRRFDDGLAWARHTEALIEREGIDGRRRAWVLNNRGTLLFRAGRLDEAYDTLTEAIEIEGEGVGDSDRAAFAMNLGTVYLAREQPALAQAELLRALRLRERVFGPAHPELLSTLTNLGAAYSLQGQYEPARATLERAFELARDSGQPVLRQGSIRTNLANVLVELGEFEAAEVHLRRAHEIFVEALGLSHPNVMAVRAGLADLYARMKRWDEAEREAQAVQTLVVAHAVEGHPVQEVVRDVLEQVARVRRGGRSWAER